MRRSDAQLRAYRALVGALCELSEGLYDRAYRDLRNERRAAFAASCSLIQALGRTRTTDRRSDLLGRIERASKRPGPRRRVRRAPVQRASCETSVR